MKKILFIGDGPDVPSGFGKATREILDVLRHSYDVTVLGINANGDRGTVPYDVYTCWPGGDLYGVGRLIWCCDKTKPDIICIQQDGWNFQAYLQQLAQFPEYAKIPVVAIVAIDGKNFQGRWLDGVALAIFWTQFALDEAREGGYKGAAVVIPLGVDLKTYYPIDKKVARKARKIDSIGDMFIVGNVNRNQPRKRWDLTLKYFAEWITSRKVNDAWLYLHTAPTGERGVDVPRLARYYGVIHRLALIEPETFYGIPEEEMRATYNCFDVCISTTQGEGMGLPAMEAMACGVPCILPDWSAYGDWAKDAALLVPCTSTAIGPPYQNVIGGVVDEQQFVKELDRLYRSKDLREFHSEKGLLRITESRFHWANIGGAYVKALEGMLHPQTLRLVESV